MIWRVEEEPAMHGFDKCPKLSREITKKSGDSLPELRKVCSAIGPRHRL
jgi:hypothetical protein